MENLFPFHLKEMDTGVALGDSSFLLIEDIGDSEADVGPNMGIADLADDDAESCSWDSLDRSQVGDLNGDDKVEGQVNVADDGEKKPREKEEEEETCGYHETWSRGGGHAIGLQSNQKSCVSVESTNEPMSEKERNRLFWEACLAS